jgi:hypothetical protein
MYLSSFLIGNNAGRAHLTDMAEEVPNGVSSGVVGKPTDEESGSFDVSAARSRIVLVSAVLLSALSVVATEASAVAVEGLFALGFFNSDASAEVLGSVKLESLVEGRLFAELDESGSLGLAVISGEQLDFEDVAAGLEKTADIAVIGLE